MIAQNDELTIAMTGEAVTQAQRLAADNPSWGGLPLRLYLEGKGCDGFYYGVAFDNHAEGDLTFPHEGVTLVVDPDTYTYVKGSKIVWVDDERGQGFLVENPRHTKFRGKFFKRKAWQDFLEKQKAAGSNTPLTGNPVVDQR